MDGKIWFDENQRLCVRRCKVVTLGLRLGSSEAMWWGSAQVRSGPASLPLLLLLLVLVQLSFVY